MPKVTIHNLEVKFQVDGDDGVVGRGVVRARMARDARVRPALRHACTRIQEVPLVPGKNLTRDSMLESNGCNLAPPSTAAAVECS